VVFRNVWAHANCSPGRASILTGRQPSDHGVGYAINESRPDRTIGLHPDAATLPRALAAAGYHTAAMGKWHLGSHLVDGQTISHDEFLLHANYVGFAWYSGYVRGGIDYFEWPKCINGVSSLVSIYATTDTANETINQIAAAGSQPYFAWVAFRAPHGPLHAPPDHLHSFGDLTGANGRTLTRAMTEAMDTEIARILQYVDLSTTTVFFIGDNGTYGPLYRGPGTLGKGTVYEGGLVVPLIVAGQAVDPAARGQEVNALVQSTDLYATILEMAGLPNDAPDSISLLPYFSDPTTPSLRDVIFSEIFEPNGGPIDPARHERAARDARYKLLQNGLDAPEFYDLQEDPGETTPLGLEELSAQEFEALLRLHGFVARPRRCAVGMGAIAALALAVALRRRALGALLRWRERRVGAPARHDRR
jgi:arylsulfatase A-like enzyme